MAPSWHDNLGPPPYGQFVPRPELLARLAAGLARHRAVVLLSIGGMGKTSLAYQLAAGRRAAYHDGGPAAAAIDGVVWISDKDSPGATTLALALELIARTLDHPGLSGAELRPRVEALLAQRRLLIVLDNVETVTDRELLLWLLRAPAPTRLLITSRELRPEFDAPDLDCSLIEVGGMAPDESGLLIRAWADQIGLRGGVGGAGQAELVALTGGSPQALRQLLGYLKRTGQSVAQARDAFALVSENLLPELFARSWALLDQEARAVLLAMTIFHGAVGRAALAAVSGYDERGLSQAIAQLTDLALLNVAEAADPAGSGALVYGLHPLTRRFVELRQAEQPRLIEAARERWLAWAAGLAASFGYQLKDLGQLNRLDLEEPTLAAALEWAAAHDRSAEVVYIARGLEFYYYVRGWWRKKLDLHLRYIAAARRLADREEQINALTMHIQLLCRLGRLEEAEPFFRQLTPLVRQAGLQGQAAFHVQHAIGLYQLTRGAHGPARRAWQQILDQAAAWQLPDHMPIGARYWLAISHFRQGDLAAAARLFGESLAGARAGGYDRWVARNQLHLALVALAAGGLPEAAARLAESRSLTDPSDREQLAHLYRAEARLHAARGQQAAARQAYQGARDLFSRMGLEHELDPADADLLHL